MSKESFDEEENDMKCNWEGEEQGEREDDLGNQEDSDIFVCNIGYDFYDDTDEEISKGDAEIRLRTEEFLIKPKLDTVLEIRYREIIGIIKHNYRIEIQLVSKEWLVLREAGYLFDALFKTLFRLRNDLMLGDIMAKENKCLYIEGEYSYHGDNLKFRSGECEIHLYQSSLIIICENGEYLKLPITAMANIAQGNWRIDITTDMDEKLTLLRLGPKYDLLCSGLSRAIAQQSMKTQEFLKECFPKIEASVIRKLARVMKDGKAVRRGEIQRISHQLWQQIEERIYSLGAGMEYEFLKAQCQQDKIAIGVKQGLMGQLTGQYIWFLAPIYDTDKRRPGNVVALGSASSEQGGRATYFFKMVRDELYLSCRNMEELNNLADLFIKKIIYCLQVTDFRREPLYLSQDKLNHPQYIKYRIAIDKIPALRTLREDFLGRVVHRNENQWLEGVKDILNKSKKEEGR